jgi:hypothetical protein
MTGSTTPCSPEQIVRTHARTILAALQEAAEAGIGQDLTDHGYIAL